MVRTNEIASAIGALYRKPLSPHFIGRRQVRGTRRIKSLARERIVASTGLPMDWKKTDEALWKLVKMIKAR